MTTRTATCACGQLQAVCEGDPVRISVCHCLECKKRSGSAFATQARWPNEQVRLSGSFNEWQRTGDSGSTAVFRFCPGCGSTLVYEIDDLPGLTAVAVGGFAEPAFPAPDYSVYEGRKHAWVEITGEGIDHIG
jgi:hypothetical protein